MIYKITSKNSVNTSYLMGTIHISDSDVIYFLESAKSLIKLCNMYIGEMNLGLVIQDEASKAMQLNDSSYYATNYFNKKKLEKIDFVLKKYFKMDVSILGNQYPILVQNLILLSKLKNDYPRSMDQELYEYAMAIDRQIDGLETPQEQYSYLTKLDIHVQWQQFYNFICMPNKYVKELMSMKQNYILGRDKQLYRQVYRSMGSFRKVMLFERNELMAYRMIEQLKERTIFATVGAGHLFGNSGMIAILKKNGYKVEKYLD